MRVLISSLAALVLVACAPDIEIDPGEENPPALDGPTVEFDPSASIIPFPNNLLLDPATGLLNLPEQCDETPTQAGLRTQVLNALDGYGTYKTVIQVTFTEEVDPASLTDRIVLYRRATGMTPVDPAGATATPVVLIPGTQERDAVDCSGSLPVNNVTIIPAVPLDGGSTYTVALLSGITNATGDAFLPSATWSFVRQATNPVTVEAGVIVAERTPFDPEEDVATLLGIDLLWNAHAGALAFIDGAEGLTRDDILLGFDFNTQTTRSVLDPAVAGSVASMTPSAAFPGVGSILGGATVTQFIDGALGAGTCTVLPCAAVGDIVAGPITAPQYQVAVPNPLAAGDDIPGPWADPRSPAKVADETFNAIAFIPLAALNPEPPDGYPVVIFGHGITRSQNDLLAVGSQLAGSGFVAISIDWVNHGSRATITSDDVAVGCGPAPLDPTALPHCHASFLSGDLPGSRDNLRQSALDGLALIETLKACGQGTVSCGAISIDPTRIGYLGHSLGGILGTMITQMSPDIKAAVLNVAGVAFLDIVENTENLDLTCPLVDGLIAAGVVSGEVSNFPVTPRTGLCTGDGWKTQPGFASFAAAGRWVFDPGDSVNFATGLQGRTVLLQQVVDDGTVPNVATDILGGLIGLTKADADSPDGSVALTPSAAILDVVTDPKWVVYTTQVPDLGAVPPFPGNTYGHGSLLQPASADTAGSLGTGQMQTDAIAFLTFNLAP